MDVSKLLFGHSKALFSTWIYYKPDHLLIDCGEGAATSLGKANYAIESILLTHGHIDHISGLPSLLWSRAAGMGDNCKPLKVFYPSGDPFVAEMRLYLERTMARLSFELCWIALEAGASFSLRGNRALTTFTTNHVPGQLTLGYKIVERRRRLKPEFRDLSQEQIRSRARAKTRLESDNLMEEYEAIIAGFGGDGSPLDPADVLGCDLLLHEATLLDARDRKQQVHSTLDEAVQVAVKAGAGVLVLYHFSGRYTDKEIRQAGQAAMLARGVHFPVWCLQRDKLWKVNDPKFSSE